MFEIDWRLAECYDLFPFNQSIGGWLSARLTVDWEPIELIAESIFFGVGVAAAGWLSSRYAWWRAAAPWDQPRVLMYHMVCDHRPGTRFNKLRVTPAAFAQQIQWLHQRGFHFVFASQLFSNQPLREKSVCITFDDGYEDNLLAADPVLAKFGAVATLYLVGDRTGGWSSKKKVHHADDELQAEPKLSDEQVESMLATRRWELGGHTKTHANLTTIDDATAYEEIAAARSDFIEKFGTAPATFAYPFGLFESKHATMVREAGFIGAVTVEPGIAPRPYRDAMSVPRVKISGKDGMISFALRMRGGKRGAFS